MARYEERKHLIVEKVGELSGDEARAVLADLFDAIVTDNAGLSESPFAYMYTKAFRDLESRVMEAGIPQREKG